MAPSKLPLAYLTRRETFSACHRLHSDQLNSQENIDIFGKCNNPNGHGHNYVVEVTIKGSVDPITGMVMNIHDMKKIINKTVMQTLDHKHLDKDVPYFENVVSTTENVAIYIFNAIKSELPNEIILHEIKIWETEKNIVIYRGD